MNELELIVIGGLGAILGFFVGWKLCDRVHKLLLPDLIKIMGIDNADLDRAIRRLQADQDQDTPIIELAARVEQHGDQLYVFRKDDDTFLVQGRTSEEIWTKLDDQNRNKPMFKLIISREDGADLLQKSH